MDSITSLGAGGGATASAGRPVPPVNQRISKHSQASGEAPSHQLVPG